MCIPFFQYLDVVTHEAAKSNRGVGFLEKFEAVKNSHR